MTIDVAPKPLIENHLAQVADIVSAFVAAASVDLTNSVCGKNGRPIEF